MREFIFTLVSLFFLSAPSFILCDPPPQEDKATMQICMIDSYDFLQDVELNQPDKEVFIPDKKINSKAVNVRKAMNTPAYRNMRQGVKEKIHRQRLLIRKENRDRFRYF